jgi:hypothetical protein
MMEEKKIIKELKEEKFERRKIWENTRVRGCIKELFAGRTLHTGTERTEKKNYKNIKVGKERRTKKCVKLS